MKNDHYLNLCLEQAAQSPLYFRHGSIVVKGGKVIGRGFNDYRSGYDGGALKSGRLPTRFSTANKELKYACNSTRPGIADRGSDGHGHVNMCFSMHSEMMAINSALSLSSTLAASAASSRRNLPRRPPQGAAVKSYVERVCLEAMGPEYKQRTGATEGQEWRFEAGTPQCFRSSQQERGTLSSESESSESEPESETES